MRTVGSSTNPGAWCSPTPPRTDNRDTAPARGASAWCGSNWAPGRPMTTTKERKQLQALYTARLARAFPLMSAHSADYLGNKLARIESRQHTHTERDCSEEWYQDHSERIAASIARAATRWIAEARDLAIEPNAAIVLDLEGDPRGRVVLLQLPGEVEPC